MADYDKELLGGNHVESMDDIAALPQSAQVVYVSDLNDEKLGQLARFPNIRDLHADGCASLTDGGLAQIRKLEKLETLDIEGATSLSDDAVDHLIMLTNLKCLDMRGCPQISKDATWRLTSALSGCEVDVDITE